MTGKHFRYILLILFISFLALYISSNAGLIDYQAKHKKDLTEQQIKQFESDIKNDVNIDIKKYIDSDEEKYDNMLSKATLKVSNTIGYGVKNVIDFFFNKVEKAMND